MNDSRTEEMRRQCQAYHEQNPIVWDLFVEYAKEMRNAGHSSYSSQAVIERLRWDSDLKQNSQLKFKINNNYTAFYARRYNKIYGEFFRERKQTSEEHPATGLAELGPDFFEKRYASN